MTTKLEELLSNLETVPQDDLKAIQKRVSEKIEQKEFKVDLSKVGYCRTSEEIEALLAQFMTPEEIAAIDENVINKPLNLPKTLTEYISEDREDRF